MADEIRDYFLQNVQLAETFNNILVDFLGEEATSYTLEFAPTEQILKRYADGGSLRQLSFQFGSKEYYDNSIAQNINNLGFYERFQEEIEYNNKNGILPNIEGIQSIECLGSGSIQDVQNGKAKYTIPMRITYLKEG